MTLPKFLLVTLSCKLPFTIIIYIPQRQIQRETNCCQALQETGAVEKKHRSTRQVRQRVKQEKLYQVYISLGYLILFYHAEWLDPTNDCII